MMRKILMSSLVGILLIGCASQEFKDNLKFNEEFHQSITDQTTYNKKRKVEYISKPPLVVSPVIDRPEQKWMENIKTVNVSELPLAVVLEQLMRDVDVPIYFSEKVKPNLRVSLNYSSTRRDILNLLSRESGYGIEFKNGRIEITDTVTKTFFLKLPIGSPSGQLGSQGEASGDDSTRVEGQFINVTYEEMNVAEEIASNIINLLGGEDVAKSSVSTSKSMSSITVTATPDQMLVVDRVIDAFQKQLEKQVLLDVQILYFRSNLGTERGVDWNIVRDTGNGILKFVLPGTNTISDGSSYGLAFEGTGKWSGTEALVKVLEKQGSVSQATPITAVVMNNQPARLTQRTLEPYVYDATTNTDEGVTTQGFTRDTAITGVDFMSVANVQPEKVWLRLSGKLQAIVARDRREVAGVMADFLKQEESEINLTNNLLYGQTLVIASIKQTSRTANKVESFLTSIFGGTDSSNDTVETLVLLTPRKI